MKDVLLQTEFTALGLVEPLVRALTHEGYTTPTPIQAQAIPPLLDGRDLLGIAQTGTGKTASFALPILQRLSKLHTRPRPHSVRALILAPTRELAAQIADSFKTYGRNIRFSTAVIVGGAKHGPQIRALQRGVDVLVATPGRLLDHIQAQHVQLGDTEVVVLDEADHMLDLGFLVPIQKIVRMLPPRRQTIFFSATMPKQIGGLATDMLKDPVQVSVTPVATTAEKVNQKIIFIEAAKKRDLLVELLTAPEFGRTLVFTRTKHGADRVCMHLEGAGVTSAAIHGNKSQSQRERALADFKSGRTQVLVATDIAARGIDVDGVTHVINFELPNVPETYVHRIGRTARAGAEGSAVSFCDHEERAYLRDIEKLTRQTIPNEDRRVNPHAHPPKSSAGKGPQRGGGKPQGASFRPQNNGKPGAQSNGRPGGGRSGAPRRSSPRSAA